MNTIALKATNIDLTDAIRTYVTDKLSALDKFVENFEPAAQFTVEVGKSSKHHNKGPFMRCEMNLTIPGVVLRVEEEREDLYEAIDVARDDLKRQLIAHKDKMIDRNRNQRPDKM